MRLPTLDYATARRLAGVRFVDLRSPAEHARDHVPGAASVPLFDDLQRAVVGTLYKQVSPDAAWQEGLRLAEERLPGILDAILGRPVPREAWLARFRELARRLRSDRPPVLDPVPAGELESPPPGRGPLVLYCWRGGMRSRSVAMLLRALGEPAVYHLTGGYKGYRAWVRARLAAFDPGTPLLVLRGPTGTGKTRILRRLEELHPGTVVDLEGMAGHRSSILGDIGLEPAATALFESRLAARLDELGPPPWWVEGESRKVGDIVVPAPFFQAMEAGVQVRVDAPLEYRCRLLREDYLAVPGAAEALAGRLPFLEARLGREWAGRLQDWLRAGDWEQVARVLLERYYDPRYARSDRRRLWTAHLDATDPELPARLWALRQEVADGAGAETRPCPGTTRQ